MKKLLLILFLTVTFVFAETKSYSEGIQATPISTAPAVPAGMSSTKGATTPILIPSTDSGVAAPTQGPTANPFADRQVTGSGQATLPVQAMEAAGDLSHFEAYVRGEAPFEISRELNLFGYSLFAVPPSTFAPVDYVPVSPDYMLGPGDEIKISFWGKLNGEYTLNIDREGMVNFPELGMLNVAGFKFGEAKDFLTQEFGKYYKPSEVKINISMGKLRTIRVFVVGKAKSPGSYTVSSLSTVINALISSGGPSKAGSMRNIEIKRAGKTVLTIDIYEFLMKGDKSADIKLQPEDVIFIPPTGKLVGIAGNVKQPAIYELKGDIRLKDLIDMAGGISATGYMHRIQVERIHENQAKIVKDLNLSDLGENENIILNDGDLIKIFPIINVVINQIELKGNVLRPGSYEWKKGVRLKDIIKSADDLMPDTYFEAAMIERYVSPDYHREYVSVNLGQVLLENSETANIELLPLDIITVFNKWQIQEKRNVNINGAVHNPGQFEYRSNMRVSDLLNLAGGAKYFAYLDKAELTRLTPSATGPVTERIIINLSKAAANEPANNLLLKENDHLFVRAVPEWEMYRNVTVSGEVRFPGTYMIHKGEQLSSLIERAGSFSENAYLGGAVFTRESVRNLQQKQLDESLSRLEQELLASSTVAIQSALNPDEAAQEKMAFEQKRNLIAKLKSVKAKGRVTLSLSNLEKLKGSQDDISLEDGDVLFIPERPNEVHVIGAVYNQTAFLHRPKIDISDYIELAGGTTKRADIDEMYVVKVNGSAISKRESGVFFNKFNSTRLDPGDTIVVPERVEKVVWLKEFKDITQILYQIAVTAGVLIVAF